MGDAADTILEGIVCQECGAYIGEAVGYPRSCGGCDPGAVEASDNFGARRERLVVSRARRADATTEFDEAARLAGENGLKLRRCSEAHYQLKHVAKNWLLNIYPGNGRLYNDLNHNKPPFFGLDPGWTLLDVTRAAVERERGAEVKR